MKILMIASGNTNETVSPIIQAQADSLRYKNVDVIVYPITGKGITGYAKHIIPLIFFIKNRNPDVVHAHYSLCGYLATLATRKPVVVSIMGSFPQNNFKRKLVKWCIRNCWDITIVKSERTAKQLDEKELYVLPNGVNFDIFKPYDKEEARKQCGFSENKKYIIFVSNPARPEKKYTLAKESVNLLNDENVELLPVYNMPHREVALYMAAADVLLMTSTQEGSPNVIKEAMACNCPIVSTDVGDVRWIVDGVEGCYVANTFRTEEISNLLQKALEFKKETGGRDRLIQLDLDSKIVSDNLISLYKRFY